MILLLSRENAEQTTDTVIDWLRFYKRPYYRFNGEDFFNGKVTVSFALANGEWRFVIREGARTFYSHEITAVWYRRTFDYTFRNRIPYPAITNARDFESIAKINNYHYTEIIMTYNLFERALGHAYWLNKPSDPSDKLKILQVAQQCGLTTPSSFVTNSKDTLETFLSQYPQAITKAVYAAGSFPIGNVLLSGMTTRITQETLPKCPHSIFFPSFFQQEIKKKYEIRVFYLEKQLFAVAIFSQRSKKTELDYRNYDNSNPNRMEVVAIPKELEEKICVLMETLNMNCGSLDFIKSTDNQYYFLEVNPVGQFLGISDMGNFNIDKHIAEILIEKAYGRT